MKQNRLPSNIVLCLIFFAAFMISVNLASAASSPSLGAAGSYSVLAGSIVTNTGPTIVSGDLGISPSIGVPPHYTGFPPGIVGLPGAIHDADAHAAAAQAANTAAFGALSAVPNVACDVTYPGASQDLVGLTLVPGVYCADAFTLSGTLNLDDSGNPNGVWIFRSASTLITSSGVGAKVQFLTGVGSPCNVWWKVVSSATIGVGTSFMGNVLASTSISMLTGASLNGRALTQTAQVSLQSNTITQCTETVTPVCGDGIIQGTEECESDGDCSDGQICNNLCTCAASSDCIPLTTLSRQCGQTDVGECSYGEETRACSPNGVWGTWGPCVGVVNPVQETCWDGKDNNCNGRIDEDCVKPVPVMAPLMIALLGVALAGIGIYGYRKQRRQS